MCHFRSIFVTGQKENMGVEGDDDPTQARECDLAGWERGWMGGAATLTFPVLYITHFIHKQACITVLQACCIVQYCIHLVLYQLYTLRTQHHSISIYEYRQAEVQYDACALPALPCSVMISLIKPCIYHTLHR